MGRCPLFIAVLEMQCAVVVALLLLLIEISGAHGMGLTHPEEVVRLNQKFHLRFSMPIDQAYKKILTIDDAGICELVLESNIERNDIPEIGLYFTNIPEDEARRLKNQVLSLSDVPLPDQGPFPPGHALLEVSLEENGNRQARLFDPYVVPKRFQVIGRKITEIEKQALENMRAGLRLEFSLDTEHIDREAPMGITVMLTNPGIEPVHFFNPLNPPDDGFGCIVFMGKRSDIAPDEIEFFHRQSSELTRTELRSDKESEVTRKRIIELGPNEILRFDFRVVLDWPPGAYNVKVSLDTIGAGKRIKNLVAGRMVTRERHLEVTGRPKPEDKGATHYEPPMF